MSPRVPLWLVRLTTHTSAQQILSVPVLAFLFSLFFLSYSTSIFRFNPLPSLPVALPAMLSSSQKDCNFNLNPLHRFPSSSSPSSLPPSLYLSPAKTMEEVWNDINLASLNTHQAPSNSAFRSVIFQDFLARSPFDPPAAVVSSAPDNTTSSLFAPGSPAPPLVTALSLGSTGPDFPFDPLSKPPDSFAGHRQPPSNALSFTANPFESLACAPGFPALRNKRQYAESDHDNSNSNNSSGNVRHKRMIKNRESAARSRARKQAYTNELEQKVDFLSRENERLRRQQEQLCKASAAPKKNPLYRTSTAPF